MNLKTLSISIALIVVIAIATVYAGIWIYSNIVPVTVSAYSFQDSLIVDNGAPTQYSNITFSGTLYYGGTAVSAGYDVTLFKNDVPTVWNLTDSDGKFSITYNVTEVGTFNFKAGYETP